MSYLVIDVNGIQRASLTEPENIPDDALYSGLANELPEEFKSATQSPDAEGFRQWRRSDATYRAWRAANLADVSALEFDIDKGDLDSALITWNQMTVEPEMQALLVAKLTEFGFLDVVAKLAS